MQSSSARSSPIDYVDNSRSGALMKSMTITVLGTVLYFIAGKLIDTVLPGANMLGLSFQGLVLSVAALVAALWLVVRLELFE